MRLRAFSVSPPIPLRKAMGTILPFLRMFMSALLIAVQQKV